MSAHDTIGVVGLGRMGGGMARHLVDDGWTVFGYDLDGDALAAAADYGVAPAESSADLAGRVDVVITSLPTPDSVEAAYLGDDGIAAGAGEGLVALEMSTIAPHTTESIVAAAPGLSFLDAPVSGGPERAREGTLTVMVGGDRPVFEDDRVQAALDAVGANVYHLGDVGAGHTTKLLNNQIGAGVRMAFLEAAAVAAVRDVDWEAFMQVVRHSSGSSYQFRKKMPRILNRDFEPGFELETSRKDIRLALEMADSEDVPTFVTSVVYELYKRAMAEGLGDEDTAALVKLFEDTTGVPVESDETFGEDFLDWSDI